MEVLAVYFHWFTKCSEWAEETSESNQNLVRPPCAFKTALILLHTLAHSFLRNSDQRSYVDVGLQIASCNPRQTQWLSRWQTAWSQQPSSISPKERYSGVNDYRPLALTPIITRCFEKLIHSNITSAIPADLEEYGAIDLSDLKQRDWRTVSSHRQWNAQPPQFLCFCA